MNNDKRNILSKLSILILLFFVMVAVAETASAESNMEIIEKSTAVNEQSIYKIKVSDGEKEINYEVTKEVYDSYQVGDNYSASSITSSNELEEKTSKETGDEIREPKIFSDDELKEKVEDEDESLSTGDKHLIVFFYIILAILGTFIAVFPFISHRI